MAEDPFDQQLSAALDPLLQPLTTLLSRTPALSNMLVGPLGVDSPVVSGFPFTAGTPMLLYYLAMTEENCTLVRAALAVQGGTTYACKGARGG